MSSTGEKIRKFRKWRGLTQQQLADETGLSVMSIRRYETGEREPTEVAVEAIAEVLTVNPSEIDDRFENSYRNDAIRQSIKMDDYVSALGYEFHASYPDPDTGVEVWLCVDSNEKKLYLVSSDAVSAAEQSIHDYVKFQMSELIKKGKEIPDTDGWFAQDK